MSSRARRLPPDERRAALIAATLPLISEHGPHVSTRQIACAAGVAEGTIFGVFRDKESLIQAAVTAAFDPDPVVHRLAALDEDARFEDRLLAAVEILQQRIAKVLGLVTAIGMRESPDDHVGTRPASHAAIVEALSAVFARDADRLRIAPAQAARLIRLIVFAGTHPRITDDNPLSAHEIVDLLLNGITASPSRDLSPHTCPASQGA